MFPIIQAFFLLIMGKVCAFKVKGPFNVAYYEGAWAFDVC